MNWDQWVGSLDGRPAMFIKRLVSVGGCRIDLHKFGRADDPGCFHTHPAKAIRVVFWGGYFEQMESGEHIARRPGFIGIVRPETSHRIAALINGHVSYSLWIRFRCTHRIELRGPGWPDQDQYALGATRVKEEGAAA